MRVAKAITISDDERKTLQKWARGRSTPARLILRAKIVLAAADGKLNKDIAAELGSGMKTVCLWRNRFAKCMKRHRHQEWIKFLEKIDASTDPALDLHLVADN